MLKNFLKVSLFIGIAVALPLQANAQTVELNIIGSSAYWIEAGLGANFSGSGSLIKAPCMWSSNYNPQFSSTALVSATDISTSITAVDKGSAWVAWTTGTGGTCDFPSSTSKIYAYLSTDAVVGTRCLFNSTTCTITYPYPIDNRAPDPANQILTGGVNNCGTTGECALPVSVATALNNFKQANVAATEIRPEDAEFAITRAFTGCGVAVVPGSQYLGLGYTADGASGFIESAISNQFINIRNFSLPARAFSQLVCIS